MPYLLSHSVLHLGFFCICGYNPYAVHLVTSVYQMEDEVKAKGRIDDSIRLGRNFDSHSQIIKYSGGFISSSLVGNSTY